MQAARSKRDRERIWFETDDRWACCSCFTADTYFPTSSFCRSGMVGYTGSHGWAKKGIGFLFPCFGLCIGRGLPANATGLGGA